MNTYLEKVLARTIDAQTAFEMLKKACLGAPVLAFTDKSFLLETDASKLGLGVVLSQKQPDG